MIAWLAAVLLVGWCGPSAVAGADAGGTERWVARYGRTATNLAHAAAISRDGRTVVVLGTSLRPGSDWDIVTAAYRARTGDARWIRSYDGPTHAEDYADAMVLTPDGSTVIVSGTSWGRGSDDVVVVAYDTRTGAREWARRLGPPALQDYARGLAVSPDGAWVVVTATSEHDATGPDVVTSVIDVTTGGIVWTAREQGPADDYAQAVAVSPSGRVIYVTALAEIGVDPLEHVLLAYDAATGARRWAATDAGPIRFTDDSPLNLAASGHHLYVGGTARGRYGGGDLATIAYDAADGSRIWARRFGGARGGWDFANGLALAPDGRSIVVTGSITWNGGFDIVVVSYRAATGERRWSRRRDGSAGGYDVGNAVAVSPDGSRVVVTGQSEGRSGPTDYLTLGFRTFDGAPVWSARYAGPSDAWDLPLAVAISPDGSLVVVTGGSSSGAIERFTTVAYAG